MNRSSPNLAKLEAEISAVEAEVTRIEGRLNDLRSHYRAAEQRAMIAIQRGDDRAAKAALLEVRDQAETLAPLEADLTVLGAIAIEYRRALETIDDPPESTD